MKNFDLKNLFYDLLSHFTCIYYNPLSCILYLAVICKPILTDLLSAIITGMIISW